MDAQDRNSALPTAAVLYAAKSTEDKRGSIPTQLDDGRKLAEAEGLEVVAEYSDEAASAYSGDRGPELALVMDDGTTQRLTLPVEIWFGGATYTAIVPGPRKVSSVTVDPEGKYPDVRRENNRWPAGGSQSETLRAPPPPATGR